MERYCSKCKAEIIPDELYGYVYQNECWCEACINDLLFDACRTLGVGFGRGDRFEAVVSYGNLSKLITDVACSTVE